MAALATVTAAMSSSLLLHQWIPPAPSGASDWLPDFLGLGWLAYGSRQALVLSVMPAPTRPEEARLGPFFRQVIRLRQHPLPGKEKEKEKEKEEEEEDLFVSSVAWAPRGDSLGLIASALGSSAYIFAPDGFDDLSPNARNKLGLPIAWGRRGILQTSSTVLSLSWTESGDGLLTVGPEIKMWKQDGLNWHCLWKSDLTYPQSLGAATWSAKGLAATGDGDFTDSGLDQHHLISSPKGKAVVWLWEDDVVGLQEVELAHPQKVVSIQWRPTRRHAYLQEPRRPILLTACKDGAVRLWLEINSGRAKASSGRYVKPSFFVSAVVEAGSCLRGGLGQDVFVTWALENTVLDDFLFVSDKPSTNEQSMVECEWLLGLGPNGTIALWSIFCLDDIYLPRCPRILLWKQSGNLIPSPKPSNLILMKAIAQRAGNKFSDPPSAFDLFCILPGGLFQLSRVWPSTNKDSSSQSRDCDSPEGKDVWGVQSEYFSAWNHRADISCVSLHPISNMRLAASLDEEGLVFIWSVSLFSDIAIASSAMDSPAWELCGHIGGDQKLKVLTWVPAIYEGNAVLLLGHAQGIECFTVKRVVGHHLLNVNHAISLRMNEMEFNVEQVLAIPLPSLYSVTTSEEGFVVVVLGLYVASWKVQIFSKAEFDCNNGDYMSREDCFVYEHLFVPEKPNAEGKQATLTMSARLLGQMRSDDGCEMMRATNIIAVPSLFHGSRLMGISANPYEFITTSADGVLRLWMLSNDSLLSAENAGTESSLWECVGSLRASNGLAVKAAVAQGGIMIATVGLPDDQIIRIWEAQSCSEGGGFVHTDNIPIPSPILSLDWLDIGNGQMLLGVATQHDIRVYCQSRASVVNSFIISRLHKHSKGSHWVLLAADLVSLVDVKFLAWGPKASLVVGMRDQICLYSNKILVETSNSAILANPSLSNNTPGVMQYSRVMGSGLAAVPLKKQQSPQHASLKSHNGVLCNLLNAADRLNQTLPFYHPVAIYYHLSRGDQKHAQMCIHHLADRVRESLDPSDGQLKKTLSALKASFGYLSNYWEINTEDHKKDKSFSIMENTDTSWGYGNNLTPSYMHTSDSTKDDTVGMPDLEFLLKHIERCNELTGFEDDAKLSFLALTQLLKFMGNTSKASQYASLDQPGQRFWLAVHFSLNYQSLITGKAVALKDLVIESKAVAWALHSECKETLLDSCCSDQLSWSSMSALKIGFWYTDIVQLRARMEKLARTQFLEKKDPKDCALLYIALKRQTVLLGLFKISRNEKDKSLADFLARNFQEEKNRAAALKNAYVLMGKHQHELAVAFFLLGGDSSTAVTVCAKNLNDLQLALVLCRLIEGCAGPLEQDLIRKYSLPMARAEADFWLSNLLQWLIGEKVGAIGELMDNCLDGEVGSLNGALSLAPVSKDPDVGLYCSMLIGKPSVRTFLSETSIAKFTNQIPIKTATALQRMGLPLEALEYLSSPLDNQGSNNDQALSFAGLERSRNGDMDVDSGSQEHMPNNWISPIITSKVISITKLVLALEYGSHFLQEHPLWHHVLVAEGELSSSGLLTKNEKYADSEKGLKETIGAYALVMEKVDNKVLENMAQIGQRYSVNINHITAGLVTFAYRHSQLYLECKILKELSGLENMLVDGHSICACFPGVNNVLDQAALELPNVLPSAVFARDCFLGTHLGCWKKCMDLLGQDITGFALNLMLLAEPKSLMHKGGDLASAVNRFKLANMLAFMLCVVTSWQRRQGKELLILLTSTSLEASSSCIYKTNLMAYFEELFAQQKPHDSSVGKAESGKSKKDCEISLRELVWWILGLALWDHLFTCFKVQLTRVSDEEWYKTFCEEDKATTFTMEHFSSELSSSSLSGIVDVVESEGSMEFSNISDPMLLASEESILKSLASISSVMRRQVTTFLKLSPTHPFTTAFLNWLWGNGLESLDMGLGSEDESLGELWNSLVIREKIACALEQEGLNKSHKSLGGVNRNNGWVGIKSTETVLSPNSEPLLSLKGGGNLEVGKVDKGKCLEDMEEKYVHQFQKPVDVLHSNGELLQALCINSCCSEEIVVASNRKGLTYVNLRTHGTFSESDDNLWSLADWPRNGWAKSESTPMLTFVSPGVGLGSKEGPSLGLGGATVGLGTSQSGVKDLTLGAAGFGIPGYGGVGAMGLGWEEWDDFDGFVDPPATTENVITKAMAAHPLRPLFLVGSSNTHVYLWEYGKSSATATYGVLPAANVPPPYALASVAAIRFGCYGHRFATAAVDGTVCTWQLEVGGQSNVRPTESCLFFDRHASDVNFVGGSAGIIAATGASLSGSNLIIWDTLAPPHSSRISVNCHEGGARCLDIFDRDIGGSSISPLIVTGGKNGDLAVHDFRFIATGKAKRPRQGRIETTNSNDNQTALKTIEQAKNQYQGEHNVNGMLWYMPKAHSASITKVSVVPGTFLFFTGSKDGDVKLWDASKHTLVHHWHKVHDKHTFLQYNARGFGAVVQAAVTDIQTLPFGFLTCGGDGTVKLFNLDYSKCNQV